MNNLPDKFRIIIPPQDIACEPGCLQRFASGDRQAFAWLYKNYSRKVFDYVKLMTGNESLSEDIVQDVFLKLWINREKMATVENFNGYLYSLQKNLVIDHLKRQQVDISVREEYISDQKETVPVASDILITKERRQILEQAVRKLPKQQQIVFRLKKENGWKRNKIANTLGISPFTAKGHLQKAVKNLRLQVNVR